MDLGVWQELAVAVVGTDLSDKVIAITDPINFGCTTEFVGVNPANCTNMDSFSMYCAHHSDWKPSITRGAKRQDAAKVGVPNTKDVSAHHQAATAMPSSDPQLTKVAVSSTIVGLASGCAPLPNLHPVEKLSVQVAHYFQAGRSV